MGASLQNHSREGSGDPETSTSKEISIPGLTHTFRSVCKN